MSGVDFAVHLMLQISRQKQYIWIWKDKIFLFAVRIKGETLFSTQLMVHHQNQKLLVGLSVIDIDIRTIQLMKIFTENGDGMYVVVQFNSFQGIVVLVYFAFYPDSNYRCRFEHQVYVVIVHQRQTKLNKSLLMKSSMGINFFALSSIHLQTHRYYCNISYYKYTKQYIR